MQTLSDQPIPTRSARAQRHYTVLDGLLLRKLRREHGLSQEKLASLAGISLTTIARLEGQPRPPCRCRTLARLATALGEPPDTLDPSLDVPPASQTSEAT